MASKSPLSARFKAAVAAVLRWFYVLVVAIWRFVSSVARATPERQLFGALGTLLAAAFGIVGSHWAWAYVPLGCAAVLTIIYILYEWYERYKGEGQGQWIRAALIAGCFIVVPIAAKALWEQAHKVFTPVASATHSPSPPAGVTGSSAMSGKLEAKVIQNPNGKPTALPTPPPTPMQSSPPKVQRPTTPKPTASPLPTPTPSPAPNIAFHVDQPNIEFKVENSGARFVGAMNFGNDGDDADALVCDDYGTTWSTAHTAWLIHEKRQIIAEAIKTGCHYWIMMEHGRVFAYQNPTAPLPLNTINEYKEHRSIVIFAGKVFFKIGNKKVGKEFCALGVADQAAGICPERLP